MPHEFEMPQHVIDRVLAKRGRLNVFDRFEPKKTALLVIDMQNFFVEPSKEAQSIVPNINRLAHATRDKGGTVIWVILSIADSPNSPSKWPLYHDYFFTPQRMKAHKDGLTPGHPGHALWPELEVAQDDLTVEKTRFSALIQGSSNLDEVLRERGIENLVITGTLTNMCCEATARDGMMIGYRVLMASDANSSLTDFDHTSALASIYQSFGDVRTTDEVINEVLRTGDAAEAAE